MAKLVIPASAPAGVYSITVTATDGLGASVNTNLVVTINAAGVAQVINPIYTIAPPDILSIETIVGVTVIADEISIPVITETIQGLTIPEAQICGTLGFVLGLSAKLEAPESKASLGFGLGLSAQLVPATTITANLGFNLGLSASLVQPPPVVANLGFVLGLSATLATPAVNEASLGIVLGLAAALTPAQQMNANLGFVLGLSATLTSITWDTLNQTQWDNLTATDWDTLE